MQSTSQLARGLSARHIRFMALGSAIGTGLFYGSAKAIKLLVPRYYSPILSAVLQCLWL